MRILLAIFLCGAAPGLRLCAAEPASPAGPLTLAQTIDAVLAQYPSLDAARAAVDAAAGRTAQTNAGRGLQATVGGGYTYMSLRPYVAIGSLELYETIQDNIGAAVTLRQLLTDFGRTDATVELARSGEITARDALEEARIQLGYEAIQEFYGTLLLRESVGVAEEDIRALEEALRISEKKFSGGTATKFDLLTTRVHLATARNRLADTRAALDKQEAGLRRLLGREPGSPIELTGDFGGDFPPPNLPAAIAEGLRNRPEMKLALDAERTAQLRLTAADRADRPVVAAQATGGVANGYLPDMYDKKGYVTAGVSVSIPILTGGRTAGERAEARADRRSASANSSEAARGIAADVEDAIADLTAARTRLANADLLVSQAREALALARSRYANGVVTDFELLDAQSDEHSAELARLQARYDCTLARQAVARASGVPPAP
jgi:outer membrane protein TolC